MKYIASIFLVCSMGLFTASLLLPAFCTERGQPIHGAAIILFGWLGMPLGGANLTWFANPLLAVAWITFKYPKVSFWFSIFAVIVSASFLLFTQVAVDTAGEGRVIAHLYLGYWLWLSSMVVMLAGNGIQMIVLYNKLNTQQENEENLFSKYPRI